MKVVKKLPGLAACTVAGAIAGVVVSTKIKQPPKKHPIPYR